MAQYITNGHPDINSELTSLLSNIGNTPIIRNSFTLTQSNPTQFCTFNLSTQTIYPNHTVYISLSRRVNTFNPQAFSLVTNNSNGLPTSISDITSGRYETNLLLDISLQSSNFDSNFTSLSTQASSGIYQIQDVNGLSFLSIGNPSTGTSVDVNIYAVPSYTSASLTNQIATTLYQVYNLLPQLNPLPRVIISSGTLSTPGVSQPINLTCNSINAQLVITGLSGGDSISLRMEGSLDSSNPTNYFNLSASESDTVFTSNGIFSMASLGCFIRYCRLNFISVNGTSTPSIAFKLCAAQVSSNQVTLQ